MSDREILSPVIEYLTFLADQHRQHPNDPLPVVAIGGSAGVGKTHFTHMIADWLRERKIQPIIFALEDFILPKKERPKDVFSIEHFYLNQLHEVLSQIVSNQRSIHKPTYDMRTCEKGSEILNLENCDLILFEGFYALCSHSPVDFFQYCTCGIFLDAAEQDILEWRRSREQTKTNPRSPEQLEKYIASQMTEYWKNVVYSKRNAAFPIFKDHEHRYSIDGDTAISYEIRVDEN